MKRIPPGLALLLIAPLLGELVSGHQAPLEFFNPLAFLMSSLPYGFGALLCRELIIRWQKGRLALLFLGLAYGIYEEAIVIRSVFNPAWSELSAQTPGYGFEFGFNWIYAQGLMQFHILISIYASILLAELIYSEQRQQRWLNNLGLVTCILGLLLWLPLGFWVTSFPPPALHYVLSILSVVVLLVLVRFLPIRPLQPLDGTPVKPRWFFLLGLANMSLVSIASFMTPELVSPPPWLMTFFFILLVDAIALYLLISWARKGRGWDDEGRLAFLAGLLGFYLVFLLLGDLEVFQGKSLVCLFSILCLVRLRVDIRKRNALNAQMSGI